MYDSQKNRIIKMKLKKLQIPLSICKISDLSKLEFSQEFFFLCKTDEEISLVCETSAVPDNTTEQEDNWLAFRIEGVLDFSLTGILAKISGMLAEENIGIFAVSTYNTDYILTKSQNMEKALHLLEKAGYDIL